MQLAVLAVGSAIGLYYGWRLFWFLTDDAYNAFRYISNSMQGHGYVWNPWPFRPVEGYTSFLWVVLLDLVWRWFGIEPPAAANGLALAFAYLTLLLGALMVLRLPLGESLRRHRVLLAGLVLFAVLTNRTFLAWASSGLETSMFNCFLTLWIFCCLTRPAFGRGWLATSTAAAALCYLTRPEGLLLVVITVGLVGIAVWMHRTTPRRAFGHLVASFPLLAVPIHLLWRWNVYGVWLPNTYYAKTIVGRLWYESGLQYLACFVIEYALWMWCGLLVVLLAARLLRLRSGIRLAPPAREALPLGIASVNRRPFPKLPLSIAQAAVLLALVGQLSYYTLVVGGDHFEYRVYSHLILLIFISSVWLLNALQLRLRWAVTFLLCFTLLSWPIPWMHWFTTHTRTTRQQTGYMKASVAQAVQDRLPATPGVLLRYLRGYDAMQFWLIDHAIGMRHQEHKVFLEFLLDAYPSRAEGLTVPDEEYPVMVTTGVGAWVLPTVNAIDPFGLNDYVIARNHDLLPGRTLAHERKPPPDYMECFMPNVTVSNKQIIIQQRAVPLTAETIMACEQRFTAMVTGGQDNTEGSR